MMQMNLQSRNRLTDLENELMVAMGEGIVEYFGKDVYTLLYLKWINNKELLYSTWNCSMLCGSLGRKGVWVWRIDTCIHVAESPLLST